MDFANSLDEVVEVYVDEPILGTTISTTGIVMLLAKIEEDVQFFTWYSNNVFAHEPEVGDACPDNEDVTWLPAQPTLPQVTLWEVDDSSEQVYACGSNGTTVTSIGRLILNMLGPSNSTMEDTGKIADVNSTEVVSETNATQGP